MWKAYQGDLRVPYFHIFHLSKLEIQQLLKSRSHSMEYTSMITHQWWNFKSHKINQIAVKQFLSVCVFYPIYYMYIEFHFHHIMTCDVNGELKIKKPLNLSNFTCTLWNLLSVHVHLTHCKSYFTWYMSSSPAVTTSMGKYSFRRLESTAYCLSSVIVM